MLPINSYFLHSHFNRCTKILIYGSEKHLPFVTSLQATLAIRKISTAACFAHDYYTLADERRACTKAHVPSTREGWDFACYNFMLDRAV